MPLLRRVELWVLLAIAVAGMVFVLGQRPHAGTETDVPGAEAGTPGEGEAPLQLHRCVLKRDEGTARLDIEVTVRNDGAQKIVMQAPAVTLAGARGREVPGFYLPFEPAPEIPGGSTQDTLLRFWLTAADLQGALVLQVAGRTVQVKGPEPFRLEDLPNLAERTIPAGQW